ncbi:hypothetical protein OG741_25120 [Streptomyces sp. NBC_01410]|uniref:hypothetical protein n=1 Tax=Streptomyces sp. NBC_01410 TaxID=2903856 RepID=UPI00325303D9
MRSDGSWRLIAVARGASPAPALLVLSELLTNAICHARVSPGRQVETRYRCIGDGVRIEVHDASDERPILSVAR